MKNEIYLYKNYFEKSNRIGPFAAERDSQRYFIESDLSMAL
jgi:hypothetical protein